MPIFEYRYLSIHYPLSSLLRLSTIMFFWGESVVSRRNVSSCINAIRLYLVRMPKHHFSIEKHTNSVLAKCLEIPNDFVKFNACLIFITASTAFILNNVRCAKALVKTYRPKTKLDAIEFEYGCKELTNHLLRIAQFPETPSQPITISRHFLCSLHFALLHTFVCINGNGNKMFMRANFFPAIWEERWMSVEGKWQSFAIGCISETKSTSAKLIFN